MKLCCFFLLAVAGLISPAARAGETVIPDAEQCVLRLGGEALFVAGTNALTAWAGEKTPRKYRLSVFDCAGKKAAGYIGAAGEKEELGPELVLDGGMEMIARNGKLSSLWWQKVRCAAAAETEDLPPGTKGKAAAKVTVVNGKSPWGNLGDLSQAFSIGSNGVYKLSGWLKNGPEADAVSLKIQFFEVRDIGIGKHIQIYQKKQEWKEYILYFVPLATPVLDKRISFNLFLFVIGADGTFGYGDDISLREVVSGGVNAVKIYPGRAGERQGWAEVEEGFNPYRVSKCLVEEAE